MNIIIIILATLLIIGLAAGLCYALFIMLTNFQPGSNKLRMDLQAMEGEMKPWINDLVPWNKKELELLSQEHTNKSVKKGIVTTVKGIITTIYHEPLVAYAYKKYVATKKNAIIYARTSNREFVYRLIGEDVNISIDDQAVGTLKANGALYSPKSKYLVGQIMRDSEELALPVLIGDKEVAGFIKEQDTSVVSTRAFEYLNDMNEPEEALLLSLSILELVKRELPK